MLCDDMLRLRALEPEDIDALYDWENLSDYWREGCTLAPYSRLNMHRYIEGYVADPFHTGELRLMAELTAEHLPVGLLDLYDVEVRHRRAFVGIIVSPVHQRKGYGTRSLRLMSQYCAAHLGLIQLLAVVPADNEASLALFRGAGYKPLVRLPSYLATPGGFADALLLHLPLDA